MTVVNIVPTGIVAVVNAPILFNVTFTFAIGGFLQSLEYNLMSLHEKLQKNEQMQYLEMIHLQPYSYSLQGSEYCMQEHLITHSYQNLQNHSQ